MRWPRIRAAPWPDEPFKTQRDRLVQETLRTCGVVYQAFKAAAEAAEQAAAALLKQDKAAEAEAVYARAVKTLERAQDTLDVQRRLDGDIDAARAALKSAMSDFEKAGKKAKGLRLRAQATQGLAEARAALKKAVGDPTVVRPAQRQVEEALVMFKEADGLYPDAAGSPSAEADRLWNDLRRVVHPIELDLRTGLRGLPAEEWSFRADEWAVQTTAGGQCLKAQPVGPVTLESARRSLAGGVRAGDALRACGRIRQDPESAVDDQPRSFDAVAA